MYPRVAGSVRDFAGVPGLQRGRIASKYPLRAAIQIYPGGPCENGYNERFNGRRSREVLNAEWFATTRQAQTVINAWLRHYSYIRPHQACMRRLSLQERLQSVSWRRSNADKCDRTCRAPASARLLRLTMRQQLPAKCVAVKGGPPSLLRQVARARH